MAVTAQMVKKLREMSGAGMMDCKNALTEADGDMDRAFDILREKGEAKAAKKADRIAAQGLVRVAFNEDATKAAIVEVNSETDFVAKNEEFQNFVEQVAVKALDAEGMDLDSFLAMDMGASSVKDTLTALVGKIGENMNVRRFTTLAEEGVKYVDYLHNGGLIGVVIGLKTEASAEEVATIGKDVAMQVASMSPQFLNESEVDQAYLDHEREILMAEAKNDPKNANKPEEILEKIINGRIQKELKEVCLTAQKFVKNGDLTVAQYVAEAAKALGKDVEIASMTRYEVGEGIEKKVEDFAAEVAAQING